jgi:hypothetical protein
MLRWFETPEEQRVQPGVVAALCLCFLILPIIASIALTWLTSPVTN